jgi:hypothetical protein
MSWQRAWGGGRSCRRGLWVGLQDSSGQSLARSITVVFQFLALLVMRVWLRQADSFNACVTP